MSLLEIKSEIFLESIRSGFTKLSGGKKEAMTTNANDLNLSSDSSEIGDSTELNNANELYDSSDVEDSNESNDSSDSRDVYGHQTEEDSIKSSQCANHSDETNDAFDDCTDERETEWNQAICR